MSARPRARPIDALFPNSTLTGAGLAAFEDDSGNPANWSLTSYAICAAGAERVVATSPFDTFPVQQGAIANCPTGKRLTGGGGDITAGLGQVLMIYIGPRGDLTGIAALGHEDDNGFAGSWRVRAYAICASPPPGLEVVAVTSTDPPFSATATCPTGKRLIGTAGVISNGSGEVALGGLVPNPALTSVQVLGVDHMSTGSYSTTAYAICASAPPGLELVTAQSEDDSDPKSTTASCPAGKHLLGTGGLVAGAPALVLDDLTPNATLTTVTATGLESEARTGGNWFVVAYAICANP